MSSINLLTPYEVSGYSSTPTTYGTSRTSSSDSLLGYTQNGTSVVDGTSTPNTNMFLELLVAQMSNLDPFGENNDPTQYITQLAQFSTLEQMQSMNSALENLSMITNGLLINSAVSTASDLLGKNAEFLSSTDSKETVKGKVTGVYIENGVVYMEALLDNGETKPFAYETFIKVSE